MRGGRFFTVRIGNRNESSMRYVCQRCGGIIAYGRWHALLEILYEQDGYLDLSDSTMSRVVAGELELASPDKLNGFISALAAVGWVDRGAWERDRHVISAGVLEQIDFRKKQSERGSKGGLARAHPETDADGVGDAG